MHPGITGKKNLPLEERFGVTVAVAADYVSKSSIYEMLASGDLAGRIIAGRHIVEVQGPRGLLRLCGKAPSTKRKTARPEDRGLAVNTSAPGRPLGGDGLGNSNS